ncbi:MAG: 3-dehydroquinate synthase, partial [Roseibium sp.]
MTNTATVRALTGGDEQTVRVELGQRGYDIRIGRGVLEAAGAQIAAVLPGARLAVVADETVASLHLEAFADSLDRAGLRHTAITVPPGESTKCMREFERLCDEVLAARLE